MSINKIKQLFWLIRTRFTPIIGKTVFFDSFEGQYNDNPKYISEKLHELDPSIKIVWSVSDHGKELPPEYSVKVTTGSKDYFRYAYASQVTVDNYTGLRVLGFVGKSSIRFLSKLTNKPGMLSISTWHGTPLKKIGADYMKGNKRYYCTGSDYLIAGCDYTKNILENAYGLWGRVKLYGTPRNDLLLNSADIRSLKEKLGLPNDKKIVMFAPTFRDSADMSGLSQFKDIDIEHLLTSLSNTFDGEFVFVFRVHHSVLEALENEINELSRKEYIINGNQFDDMAEYLACTDVLITDYSGSLFDFALTGRPCFLYSPDREEYVNVERGLYLDYSSIPYPKADDLNTLYSNIEDFNSNDYSASVRSFLDMIGNAETGHASERIARDIIDFINT